ncbi:homogentisate 1,2-dioxygenase [Gordonia sp. ABSL1-1]|uniref:homogentisate 1,2-dioxygenase n=1 Tax=Gordonia sp. ABSL1-1 TaxID=3053923 RepID=UPI0025740E74|nr:homogentisate 1,2-dioxygenase [Gordonia sp. ABSL1-1]MDL9935332.1 homogentisate 1,2-dioxygenase [Gordonia sp. ABSL1-1]
MESFIQHRKGRTPRQIHRDVEDLKDDELGRYGFTGRTANLYRRNDPTAYRTVGDLAGVDRLVGDLTPSDQIDAAGEPLLMFYNDDCRILLSRRAEVAPFYTRNVDGDELIFVHEGTGHFETEFGRLAYRPGDYVYIPKATTYRQIPDDQCLFLIIEAAEEFRVPEAGVLGRHFPFDSSLVAVPEAEAFPDDGREEYEVRFRQREGKTSVFYAFNPLDVEGWKGDNFPFTYNIEDYDVVTSNTVHLPPTVHLFMQAAGVYVMNFLPRPVEGREGAERPPWYHRNVDFDEIAFFHGGSMFGIEMPPGLISHAPQGIHHGMPERARERARRRFDKDQRVEWKVISIDTRKRLTPTPAMIESAQVAVKEEVQV